MRILVLNAGSSSLKTSVVEHGSRDAALATHSWPADASGEALPAVREALDALDERPDAVGYRVVHGGARYVAPHRVDDALVSAVEDLDVLAPLHNRRIAAVMRAGRRALPDLPHVACFDTAFHATLPEAARRYPLPAHWIDPDSIRRYGFHGLSVSWSVRRAAELLERPLNELGLVVAHLGSGASVTAVAKGRSVGTTMGFTPLEGLMMGTRAGSIDPGILLHLLRRGTSLEELEEGLTRRSGLRAVAGVSEVREIQERAAAGDAKAALAIQMFVSSAASAIAAAATALPRLDGVVFTGGVGEHATAVRRAIVDRLAVIGVGPGRTEERPDVVLSPGPPALLVVRAREDLVIADEVSRLLEG